MTGKFRFNDGTVTAFGRVVHNGTNYNLPGMTAEDLALIGHKIIRDDPTQSADFYIITDGALELDGDVYRQRLTYTARTPEEIRELVGPRVNAERDARSRAGFAFPEANGKMYDFDEDSRARISGAGVLAFAAIVNGAQPGDLRWADPDNDFAWIAQDNTVIGMDAQTCFAFGQAAASRESDHIFAAKTLKDMATIPEDFRDDQYWPTVSV